MFESILIEILSIDKVDINKLNNSLINLIKLFIYK